jgi:hypothetical protein
MPQFDTFSFLSQLFWLFSFFSLILLFLNYYLLPVISTILKVRNSTLLLKKFSTVTSQTVVNNAFGFKSFLLIILGNPHTSWFCYYVDSYYFLEYLLFENFIYTSFFFSFSLSASQNCLCLDIF